VPGFSPRAAFNAGAFGGTNLVSHPLASSLKFSQRVALQALAGFFFAHFEKGDGAGERCPHRQRRTYHEAARIVLKQGNLTGFAGLVKDGPETSRWRFSRSGNLPALLGRLPKFDRSGNV